MFTYEIWNKISPINGVSAEEIKKSNPRYDIDTVVLYKNTNSGQLERAELESVLRSAYESADKPLEELAQYRCDYLNKEGFESLEDLKNQNLNITEELSQAKLILMREGLL